MTAANAIKAMHKSQAASAAWDISFLRTLLGTPVLERGR